MKIEPMSEGLVRQRRNLISISCILIFLKFAGIEISKLTFLGIDFGKLGNPSALYLAIWVFYSYFLSRYYQYFAQEGSVRLSRYFYEEMERRVMIRVRKLADEVKEKSNFYPSQLIALKNDDWKIRVTYDGADDGTSGRDTEVANIQFPTNELFKFRALSLKNISVHTSAVTDYILPLILAVGALIYCSYGAPSSLYEAVKNGFA
ncbi:hypothetical protein OAE19_07470 [Porticoccaceae bacterium]|nr:hypothetical protein [Porticoccaceae bacterium]